MNALKLGKINLTRVSREARVAVGVTLLVIIGVVLIACGLHVVGSLVIAIAVALVAAFYFLIARPARIPHGAILAFRVGDGMREDAPRSPLEQLRGRGQLTLSQVRRALEAAAIDPKLAAIVVEISAPSIGLATAQELHDLLRAVVVAKKRVVAVLAGDNATVRDYLVACGAGEVVINPDTAMIMLGAAVGGLFLHNALGKLGVEAQTLQWKEYKGMGEMFNREAMSPEVRASLDAIVGDWKAILAEKVAAARKIDLASANALLAQGFISARTARESGLADRTGYAEDIHTEIDPENNDDRTVGVLRYLRHVAYGRRPERRARIALVHGLGPVVSGEPPMAGEFISGERTASEILRAARDEDVPCDRFSGELAWWFSSRIGSGVARRARGTEAGQTGGCFDGQRRWLGRLLHCGGR